MTHSLATIRVTNLRLRTYIGFNEEEKNKQQDVVINIEIRYPAEDAYTTDNVDNAVNYKTITKQVIALVENGHFLLLEKLTADVLAICSEHERVRFARVTVDKPHALRFADSVSLSLDYTANTDSPTL